MTKADSAQKTKTQNWRIWLAVLFPVLVIGVIIGMSFVGRPVKLEPPHKDGSFGGAVAADGERIVVGGDEAVYVFKDNRYETTVTDSGVSGSVAMDGGRIVVGVPEQSPRATTWRDA